MHNLLLRFLFLHGDEPELEEAALGLHAVLRQGSGILAPAVDATHTCLEHVDGELGVARARNLGRMALMLVVAFVEVADVVVQGGRREGLARLDVKSCSAVVALLPPTDVGLGACLLRSDVGIELLVGGLLVDADVLRGGAVAIVLDGSAAIE